ncbi:MAG: AMIN domain-containing protein, partial [Desulfobacula sp.]|nr:AMIN domain-containing protein [Desulfobacula sp.]
MFNCKTPILLTYFLIILLSGIFVFSTSSAQASAKQKYLAADSCYKKLRNKSLKNQTERNWLKCISQYEIIYRLYPGDSWAPAGMYKASQLYITLSKLSGKKKYKIQAADLLSRISNKYPKSAYTGRARSLLKSIKVDPRLYTKKIKHIKSKKQLTKNDVLIRKFTQNENKIYTHTSMDRDKPLPPKQKLSGDATISDLRFWSNPEYTRIVVNADRDREYSHKLLKKDPKINQIFQRLFIDIDQSRLGKNVADHTDINDNLLKQARAAQYQPHTVRVVVDIKSFENYKIFSLKDPFRIVIDVWGKGSNGSPATKQKLQTAGSGKSEKPEKIHQMTTDHLKSSDIARQLALGVKTIVIDPGHGGRDPGAPGYYKNVWEKDIVLNLAKKLAKTLRDRLQCTVLLTRSTDKKLTLEERTAIANTKKADLFISLHCNAAKNKRLKGIETYLLNLATDEQAIAVAARENATSEKNISYLEYILSDLMKHAKINESRRLANTVQTSFIKGMKQKYSGINDHGVKQAPFYVLLGARMPSILIETGFLSNKQECKRLMSNSYQTAISNTI